MTGSRWSVMPPCFRSMPRSAKCWSSSDPVPKRRHRHRVGAKLRRSGRRARLPADLAARGRHRTSARGTSIASAASSTSPASKAASWIWSAKCVRVLGLSMLGRQLHCRPLSSPQMRGGSASATSTRLAMSTPPLHAFPPPVSASPSCHTSPHNADKPHKEGVSPARSEIVPQATCSFAVARRRCFLTPAPATPVLS